MESYVSCTGVSTYNYDYASNHLNAFLPAGCVVAFIDESVNQLLYEEREFDIIRSMQSSKRTGNSHRAKAVFSIPWKVKTKAQFGAVAAAQPQSRRRLQFTHRRVVGSQQEPSAGIRIRTLSVTDRGEDDSRNGSRSPSPTRSAPSFGVGWPFPFSSRHISPDPAS